MDLTGFPSGQGTTGIWRYIFWRALIIYSRDEKNLAYFRIIEDANIVHYRGPLLKVVAMLMRLVGLSKSKKQDDQKAAELLLIGDKDQLAETHRLYSILRALEGKSTSNHLRQALHRLLQSLLCPQGLPDGNIACPTDIFLFLSSLSEEGLRSAASLKGLCCKIQFNFRIVYLHLVRIEANNITDYEPFEGNAEPSVLAQGTFKRFSLISLNNNLEV